MRVLWDRPNLSVREVVEAVPRERAYTTVMTVMNRLVEKDLLHRTPRGRAFVYTPAMTEKQFLEHLSRRAIRTLIDDFGEVAVARFVGEMRDMGPDELDKLRKLISEAAD